MAHFDSRCSLLYWFSFASLNINLIRCYNLRSPSTHFLKFYLWSSQNLSKSQLCITKWSFDLLQWNRKFYSCFQMTIRFFLQRNTKFWKLYTKIYLFFDYEIRNFQYCTEIAIRFSNKEIQNLTIYCQFSFAP